MSQYNPSGQQRTARETEAGPIVLDVEVIPGPERPVVPAPGPQRRVLVPVLLFAATCLSVLYVGGKTAVDVDELRRSLAAGPLAATWVFLTAGLRYALPLMTILLCHEMGHFIQARRYGVFATYPYFIPMPLGVIGTFGAVIAMDSRMGNRKALFDIGISGPLAGLIPTIIFCIIGLQTSHSVQVPVAGHGGGGQPLGEPLLFQLLTQWTLDPLPPGHALVLSPMAFAGWVGLLITSLNLMPIGQLDGGHVFYALLRGKAAPIATLLLYAAVVAVVLSGLWGWMLMLFLLMAMGPVHPPTANDHVPLGLGRKILGWLTLAFIVLGFTPNPFPPRF